MSSPREREERAVRVVHTAAAPSERGERAVRVGPVATALRERREHVVRAVQIAAAPPEFFPSPFSTPLPPVKRRDPGRDTANDCY